jgi:drug/metabolite transporter (DMT)-like permease
MARQALMNLSTPLQDNFALELVPQDQQHFMNALKMLLWTSSWMISARISGRLIYTEGFAPSFLLTALFYAVSTLLFWLFFLRGGRPHETRRA